jgi:hypothetical protein
MLTCDPKHFAVNEYDTDIENGQNREGKAIDR